MNDRIFYSFKEYENTYFPNNANELLIPKDISIACQLASRAIEKHADKLKNIKCIEVHSQGQ